MIESFLQLSRLSSVLSLTLLAVTLVFSLTHTSCVYSQSVDHSHSPKLHTVDQLSTTRSELINSDKSLVAPSPSSLTSFSTNNRRDPSFFEPSYPHPQQASFSLNHKSVSSEKNPTHATPSSLIIRKFLGLPIYQTLDNNLSSRKQKNSPPLSKSLGDTHNTNLIQSRTSSLSSARTINNLHESNQSLPENAKRTSIRNHQTPLGQFTQQQVGRTLTTFSSHSPLDVVHNQKLDVAATPFNANSESRRQRLDELNQTLGLKRPDEFEVLTNEKDPHSHLTDSLHTTITQTSALIPKFDRQNGLHMNDSVTSMVENIQYPPKLRKTVSHNAINVCPLDDVQPKQVCLQINHGSFIPPHTFSTPKYPYQLENFKSKETSIKNATFVDPFIKSEFFPEDSILDEHLDDQLGEKKAYFHNHVLRSKAKFIDPRNL